MKRPWVVGGLVCLACALSHAIGPPKAMARLGQPIQSFTNSLLLGDGMFRYEGRIGARYRFGPSRFAQFGPGLLALDVADGLVVQELLVLPLPLNLRMERANAHVQKLFLAQVGFPSTEARRIEATIQAAMEKGLPQELAMGTRHRLLVRVDVALKSYLLAAQLTGPGGVHPPSQEASPESGASAP